MKGYTIKLSEFLWKNCLKILSFHILFSKFPGLKNVAVSELFPHNFKTSEFTSNNNSCHFFSVTNINHNSKFIIFRVHESREDNVGVALLDLLQFSSLLTCSSSPDTYNNLNFSSNLIHHSVALQVILLRTAVQFF